MDKRQIDQIEHIFWEWFEGFLSRGRFIEKIEIVANEWKKSEKKV